MLVFPFLGASVQEPRAEPTPAYASPLEVAKTLDAAGYPLKVTESDSTVGEIIKGRARVWVGMARTVGAPEKKIPVHAIRLFLSFEFAVPKTPGSEASDAWTKTHVADRTISFAPHLGGTVTESQEIDLAGGPTKERLKTAIDAFFAAGAAYARAHRAAFVNAPKIDEARLRFDDATILDRADQISFRRAVASWGWNPANKVAYVSQGWMMPIQVGSKQIWLRQSTAGTEALDRSIEIARYSEEVAPPDHWQKAQAAGNRLPSLIYSERGAHTLAARTPVDLAKGVSLGELKRRIAEFAAQAP